MTGRVHIVGAGLAGLSTAVRMAEAGRAVSIWEAGNQAGGRCRTFWDPRLERFVDNGNHLVLSGNTSARAYLDLTGGMAKMTIADAARFAFFDAATGERWQVQMNDGRIPWWALRRDTRIPGTGLLDYAAALRLPFADGTVAQAIRGRGPLWARFWEPLTLAVLNTTPEQGAARLLWRAMAETFARGGSHCRPMFAPRGLGHALVDPALTWLAARGIVPTFECAMQGVDTEEDRVTRLQFSDHMVELGPDDKVVLALPPTRLKAALPWVVVPDDRCGILNAHFTVDPAAVANSPPITGLVNTATHWVFVRDDVVSLTISAADKLGVMDRDPAELAPDLWAEAARALGIDWPYLQARINKERRATFDQSPEGVARRPDVRTPITNLLLAGDCTRTGLPATIEGAIRSGETAARILIRDQL